MMTPDRIGAARWRTISFGALAFMLSAPMAAQANLTISANPTQNVSCADGICTATAKVAVLNVDDLAAMLASGDATIKSARRSADIVIGAALSWTSTSRLTLDSFHSIAFHAPVTVAGTAALTIITNDGGTDGDFTFDSNGHIQFSDLTSALTINGDSYSLFDDLGRMRRAFGHFGRGHFALVKSISPKKPFDGAPFQRTFAGTFEGLGNTISKLTIDSGRSGGVGLFSESSGVVRDITLTKLNVVGSGNNQYVAGLVAGNDGTVINAHVDGVVSATAYNAHIGGLVGVNGGPIVRSSAAVTVTDTRNDTAAIGGLVGASNGVLDRDYSQGSVVTGDFAGAGGLMGINAGTVSNCYSNASASGADDGFVGGLIGENLMDDPDITFVSNAYSTGSVSGGSGATLGGLMGKDQVHTGIIDTYWDLDSSGISDPAKGAGDTANDPGITGLTTAQFTSGVPAGFDAKIWKEKAGVNGGYPYLIDNPPRN